VSPVPRPVRLADDAGERACPLGVCDGSGWILGPEDVARPCECRERRLARRRARGVASAIPRKYRGVSFERPPVSDMARDPARAPVLRAVKEFADGIDERLDEGEGLWLMGDVGTGKTTLAMLVSQHALEQRRSVAIYSVPRLLAEIRRTYEESSQHSYVVLLERLAAVDLLHLDDLGAEKTSEWVLEQLYSIVNARYEEGRAMVVTTNLPPEDLREQISPRTVSRLVEMCGDPCPLWGHDRRTLRSA
jgi:DNA replication protein DnaC